MADKKIGDYFVIEVPIGNDFRKMHYQRGDMTATKYMQARAKAIENGTFVKDGEEKETDRGEYVVLKQDGQDIKIPRGDYSVDEWKKLVDRVRTRDDYKGAFIGGKKLEENFTYDEEQAKKDEEYDNKNRDIAARRLHKGEKKPDVYKSLPRHIKRELADETEVGNPIQKGARKLKEAGEDVLDFVKEKLTPDEEEKKASDLRPAKGAPARPETQKEYEERADNELPRKFWSPVASAEEGTGGIPGLAGNALNLPQMAMGAVPAGPQSIDPMMSVDGISTMSNMADAQVVNPGLDASLPPPPPESGRGPEAPPPPPPRGDLVGDVFDAHQQPVTYDKMGQTPLPAPDLPPGQDGMLPPAAAMAPPVNIPGGPRLLAPAQPEAIDAASVKQANEVKAAAMAQMAEAEKQRAVERTSEMARQNSQLALHDALAQKAQMHMMERQEAGINAYQQIAGKLAQLDPSNIDAAHYWANKSTGSKVAGAIAGFLFGFSGKGIEYLQHVQQDVKMDIDAQAAQYNAASDRLKSQLAAQGNLVAQYRQMGLSQDEANRATRANMLDAFSRKLQAIDAPQGSEIDARRQMALATIQQEQVKELDGLKNSSALRAKEQNAANQAFNGNLLDKHRLDLEAAKMRMAGAAGPGIKDPASMMRALATAKAGYGALQKEIADAKKSGFFDNAIDSAQILLNSLAGADVSSALGGTAETRRKISQMNTVTGRQGAYPFAELNEPARKDAKDAAAGVGFGRGKRIQSAEEMASQAEALIRQMESELANSGYRVTPHFQDKKQVGFVPEE